MTSTTASASKSTAAMTAPYTYRYYTLQSVAAQAYATCRRHLTTALFSSSLLGGHAPSPGDTEISIPWLQSTLIEGGALPRGSTITAVECNGLDGNRGLVGAMTRVQVTYAISSHSTKDSDAPTKEFHLILKKSRDGRTPRLGNILSGHAREAIFYTSDLAKALQPSTLLPKVYYAHGSQTLGEYVILMEDIKRRGSQHGITLEDTKKPIDVNFIFGNQIWGLPDSIKQQQASLPTAPEMLEKMFLTCAETHAQHWNDSSLLSLNWLKTVCWYKGQDRARWEWSVQSGLSAWEKGQKMAASGEFPVKYSEKFIKIMDRAFERASWERFQTRLQDKSIPFTLTHGDFHAANQLLDRSSSSPSGAPIVLYDWSEVCVWEPTTDLGQTMISDVNAQVFKSHARIALQKYHARLIELKVVTAESYTFETCWRSFLRGGIEKWLWTFGILCSYPGMPASAVQYFHDQMIVFMELAESEKEPIEYDITTVLCFMPPQAHP
ncbi:hypothetical protein BGZ83_011053 [Gryganskiella cystojenkinii]|nr:hypothetical protein BGZ83_011053 [Gryganskiella cystojenkinii]